MKAAFERDGYIIGRYKTKTRSCNSRKLFFPRRIFKSDEISKLQEALETDGGIMQHAYAVNDGQGRSSRLCIWSHPGQDITGMVARSEKIAGTMEKVEKRILHQSAFWRLRSCSEEKSIIIIQS